MATVLQFRGNIYEAGLTFLYADVHDARAVTDRRCTSGGGVICADACAFVYGGSGVRDDDHRHSRDDFHAGVFSFISPASNVWCTTAKEDNKGARRFGEQPCIIPNSKRFDVRCHFLRDRVASNELLILSPYRRQIKMMVFSSSCWTRKRCLHRLLALVLPACSCSLESSLRVVSVLLYVRDLC